METSTESIVVGVRFSKVGKVYHFESNGMVDLKLGDQVVVETSRGWQLGQVAQILEDEERPPEGWKAIDRRATPRDLLLRQMWQQKEAEVVENSKKRTVELNLMGIKIVSAEYSFDGSRLTILFSSETEEKYDLKSLRGDMQKMLAPSQVEMRQIGPRDVAKLLCGMGACGKETRCCCSFLTEFSSISIRMAKEQGISLTPSEITGMCGRLRCCLIYEYDQYVDSRKSLPKRNKRVRTPDGEGKVVDVVPLRESVLVEIPEIGVREYPGADVVVLDGEGGARPPEAKPAGDETIPVVTQPSEIDQVLSGQEISPDRVEGVGDTGSLGPVDSGPQRPPRRDNRPRSGGGPRSENPNPNQANQAGSPPSGDAARQPSRDRRPGDRGSRGGQGRGPQNRGPQDQAGTDRPPQDRTGQNRGGPDRPQSERGRRQGGGGPQDRGPQDRSQSDRPASDQPASDQPAQGQGRSGGGQGQQGRGNAPRGRNQHGRGRGPRPPQDRGPANRGPNEPDKGNTNPPTEGSNRDFQNKKKGPPQHDPNNNETGA